MYSTTDYLVKETSSATAASVWYTHIMHIGDQREENIDNPTIR